jgi:hypothetical protein
MTYRGGNYHRLYGSAVKELREVLRQYEMGNPMIPKLCTFLRKKQEYLHGTYDAHVVIPKAYDPYADSLSAPVYRGDDSSNAIQSVESRLVRSKILIGRREAEIKAESTLRTQEIIFGVLPVDYIAEDRKSKRQLLRAHYEDALHANTAFMNLINRTANGSEVQKLLGEGFDVSRYGARAFGIYDALWLSQGGKTESYSIRDISFPEDMFLREMVSAEESFKVGGIPLYIPSHGRGPDRLEHTVTHVGLYEVSDSMLEWSVNHGKRLKAKFEENGFNPIPIDEVAQLYSMDREWVNDDTLLIADAQRIVGPHHMSVVLALISDDFKLAKRIATSANCMVDVISPLQVLTLLDKKWDSTVEITPKEIASVSFDKEEPLAVLIDSGSLAANAAKLDTYSKGDAKIVATHRSLYSTGYNAEGKRYSETRLKDEVLPEKIRKRRVKPLRDPRGRRYKK